MNDTSRFSSLAELQAAHDVLLDRREGLSEGDAAEANFWPEVAAFVRRGVDTGAILDASRDRRAAQSILDYWANALYRAGLPAPEARLTDFDLSLAPELPDEPCPYRGLAAFGERDREFFFGREGLLNAMVGRLQDGERLLAVVGSSGSGKSSVVLAGLLPRLKGGALPGSEGWRYATIVPGSHPLASLARALQTAGEAAVGLGIVQTARLLFAADGFRRDPDYLAATLGETTALPLVLVVDQFEELFTLCTDEDERAAFVRQLLGLVTAAGSQHRVILTMRADLVDKVAKLPELFPLFRDARVDVETLDINELAAAIVGPAARVGLKFEEGIVDDLISTILGERAGLPLLQFTLLKLWEKRQRNRVTRETYRQVGNPREALEHSADVFYKSLVQQDRDTAKYILLHMVEPGEGREVTSKRIRRDDVFRGGEVRERVEYVLNRLIHQERLVKLTEGETEADAQIEVAHEALVRNWPRLVEWLEDEREPLRRRSRLAAAAEQWQRFGKTADALLRGALLEEALRYDDLSELETAFVQASRVDLKAAEQEREAAGQRELEQVTALSIARAQATRRLSWLAVALILGLIIAIASTLVIYRQTISARAAQATAEAGATEIARNLRVAQDSLVQQVGLIDQLATVEADKGRLQRDLENLKTTPGISLNGYTPSPTPAVPSRPLTVFPTVSAAVTRSPVSASPDDIAATATAQSLATRRSQVQATQTAVAISSADLYALVPDINITIRSQPSAGADELEIVRAPATLQVLRVDEGKWVEVQTSKGIRGWTNGYGLMYEGNPSLLPNELRLRLISNRPDLPFIYGRVVSHDGVRKTYPLYVRPEDNTGIVITIPINTSVTVLLTMNGNKAFGSGLWYLVTVVDPGGANQLWNGYLPAEAVVER